MYSNTGSEQDTIRVTDQGIIEFSNHPNSIAKVQWWDIERIRVWNTPGGRLYPQHFGFARDVHMPIPMPVLPANLQPHLQVTSRAVGGQQHFRAQQRRIAPVPDHAPDRVVYVDTFDSFLFTSWLLILVVAYICTFGKSFGTHTYTHNTNKYTYNRYISEWHGILYCWHHRARCAAL